MLALLMAFTAQFMVAPVGDVDPRTGDVRVTGKIRCSEPAHAIVEIELTQQIHDRYLIVVDFVEFECGPEPKTWRVLLRTGRHGFRPGPAFVEAYGEGFNEDGGMGVTVNQEIVLVER